MLSAASVSATTAMTLVLVEPSRTEESNLLSLSSSLNLVHAHDCPRHDRGRQYGPGVAQLETMDAVRGTSSPPPHLAFPTPLQAHNTTHCPPIFLPNLSLSLQSRPSLLMAAMATAALPSNSVEPELTSLLFLHPKTPRGPATLPTSSNRRGDALTPRATDGRRPPPPPSKLRSPRPPPAAVTCTSGCAAPR